MSQRMMVWMVGCLVGLGAAPVFGQPISPAPPKRYRTVVRYDIQAPRDQHVMQYDAMIDFLKGLNFEFDPPLEKRPRTDREDPSKNQIVGFVPAKNARAILRQESVASLMLMPDDFKLPEKGEDPVTIHLDLPSGYSSDRQRELADQIRVLLRELDFQEAVGYDHRGNAQRPFSRLLGTIPAGKLDTLLKDLRELPGGWFSPPLARSDLPSPLSQVYPLRVVEVLKDPEPLKVFPAEEPRGSANFEKFSADLWNFVKDKENADKTTSVQLVFANTTEENDAGLVNFLREVAPSFEPDAMLGAFVSGTATAADLIKLSQLPTVSVLRLPRALRVDAEAGPKVEANNARALSQSGIQTLHAAGARGQNVRLAILDTDFRGWQTLVQRKKLPSKTRLVDLTKEAKLPLLPAPYEGDLADLGHGTICAQAAAVAAPDAEIVLIRVDGKDPSQLLEVLRYLRGGPTSFALRRRRAEIDSQTTLLEADRAKINKIRQEILSKFDDDTELRETYGFLGPVFGWVFSDRDWSLQQIASLDQRAKVLAELNRRFFEIQAELESLRGIPVVANALTWNDGYPLGGANPISRGLDELVNAGPLWFQSVGNTRGQAWVGNYRSKPGGNFLEFVSEETPLAKQQWSREMNYLAWWPHRENAQQELPENAKVRLTLQWREPHDPNYYLAPGEEDRYRKPLAQLTLKVLRQRDPEGKTVPSDFFDAVARTTNFPERIEHLPGGSVYEHVLEVNAEKAGRYAVMIEKQADTEWELQKVPVFKLIQRTGLNPTGLRPLGVPTLPALEPRWELRPRLFVEVIDSVHRPKGRIIWRDFRTETGTIGLPADSRGVIAVGAIDLKDQAQPSSATGSPAFLELVNRPLVWTYDTLELDAPTAYGSSVANAFAAGAAASLLSSGVSRDQVNLHFRSEPGRILRVNRP